MVRALLQGVMTIIYLEVLTGTTDGIVDHMYRSHCTQPCSCASCTMHMVFVPMAMTACMHDRVASHRVWWLNS